MIPAEVIVAPGGFLTGLTYPADLAPLICLARMVLGVILLGYFMAERLPGDFTGRDGGGGAPVTASLSLLSPPQRQLRVMEDLTSRGLRPDGRASPARLAGEQGGIAGFRPPATAVTDRDAHCDQWVRYPICIV